MFEISIQLLLGKMYKVSELSKGPFLSMESRGNGVLITLELAN